MQESFEWIASIIKSCNNKFHFDCADKMVDLFFQKYKDEKLKLELLELLHEMKVAAEVV